MKAQTLYDLREQYEFCSGTDLHEFFNEQVGEPSPSGRAQVDTQAAKQFMATCAYAIEHNSPSISMAAFRQAAGLK